MLSEISRKDFTKGISNKSWYGRVNKLVYLVYKYCDKLGCTYIGIYFDNKEQKYFVCTGLELVDMPPQILADFFDDHIPDNDFSQLLREV